MAANAVHWVGEVLRVAAAAAAPALALPALALFWPDYFASIAARLAHAAEALSEALLSIALWAGFVMTLAQFAAVLLRYLFGFSAGWLGESVIYAYAGLFMLAAAGALKGGAHVRIDVLFAGFRPETKAAVDFLGVHLALWPMMILLLTAGERFVGASWAIFERSAQSDGLPAVFLLKSLIPVFAVAMIAQGLAAAVRAGAILRGEGADSAGPDPRLDEVHAP